ncbi:hypothetical protein [Streptomyces sp. b94]|nr:hypothetical protein [Streptomyces sp. b94]
MSHAHVPPKARKVSFAWEESAEQAVAYLAASPAAVAAVAAEKSREEAA